MPSSSSEDLPMLTSVRVVCRNCLVFYELPHVVERINRFVGVGSMEKACILGSVRLMSYVAVRDVGVKWDNVVYRAIKNGHVHILQWMSDFHADQGSWDFAVHNAVCSGHLEVVKWLHANGKGGYCYFTMSNAARNGRLDLVKWLGENGPLVCSGVPFVAAAEEGHLEIVQWLYANGYKGNIRDAMEVATEGGHSHVIKWLLSTIDDKEYKSYAGFALDVVKKTSNYPYREVSQWLELKVKPTFVANNRRRLAY